jgi:hypothetical protein
MSLSARAVSCICGLPMPPLLVVPPSLGLPLVADASAPCDAVFVADLAPYVCEGKHVACEGVSRPTVAVR